LIAAVREAYLTLRLEPFDQFARNQAETNTNNPLHDQSSLDPTDPKSPIYRGIGVTTWMSIYGAVRVRRGENILLAVRSEPPVDSLVKLLGPEASVRLFGRMNNSGRIWNESDPELEDHILAWSISSTPETVMGQVDLPSATILREPVFRARLARRVQGPFAMADVIMKKNGRRLVYAEDEEYLFEITRRGARDLAEQRDGQRPIQVVVG
jgi:hypothetical protein